MSMQAFPIVGLTKGLQTNVKPAMLPNQAWSVLENAYTFRERELKREGRLLLGRLRRLLTAQSLGTTTALATSMTFADILTTLGLRATQPQAEIEPGSLVITIAAPDASSFTDNGDGTFAVTGLGVAAGSYVDYVTGMVVLKFSAPLTGGSAISANLNYFPTLPVMGIIQEEQAAINAETTIWFDTVYAYVWNGSGFQEFIPGTTWNGGNSDLFWGFNYRGTLPSDRLLFVTNDVVTAANPIRYTDGSTWTTFAPVIADNPPSAAQSKLFQCRILIAYYGRLLALNTWEGTTAGGYPGAVNFFNRCRFSQYAASPIDQANAWRSDVFGRGGFIDAPTNEAITGATFIKNTLVVDFERTTWQLRYVGEYGTPFIWERISADFGSESTFSGVLFDNHRLAVGDKAITAANGGGVDRIDLDIPDQIFQFKNANSGVKRVTGIRDYKRELVFWNYPDAETEAAPGVALTYPNKVLLYNYRNQTWAIFRDSITCFGTFQSTTNITWDSLEVLWDNEIITWDDPDTQSLFPLIVCGDQQGFVSCYGYDSPATSSAVNANDQETLTIQGISTVGVGSAAKILITSVDHNLQNAETIYITGLMFVDSTLFTPVATNLNNVIYQVLIDGTNTKDNFYLLKWDGANYDGNFSYTPVLANSLYIGGGRITLFPKLNILSKDINLFQGKSMQTKLSRLDFLFQSVPGGSVTIKLFLNSSANGSTPGVVGQNNLVWNSNMSIDALPPYYTPGSDYSWFRYYATLSAQYFAIQITYDDNLMNTLATHSQDCTLYGINAWCRMGGKITY